MIYFWLYHQHGSVWMATELFWLQLQKHATVCWKSRHLGLCKFSNQTSGSGVFLQHCTLYKFTYLLTRHIFALASFFTSVHCSAGFTGWRLLNVSPTRSLFWHTDVNVVWCQHTCVANYIDQQTLKPDDDYFLHHQCLWIFGALFCPLSATERFLLQPLVCGTVFHHTSLLLPLSPSSAVILLLSHTSSHFLILLSDSCLICIVPLQWLIILDTIIVITLNV